MQIGPDNDVSMSRDSSGNMILSAPKGDVVFEAGNNVRVGDATLTEFILAAVRKGGPDALMKVYMVGCASGTDRQCWGITRTVVRDIHNVV